MLIIYVITLSLSAGLVGLFGHAQLAALGYVPGFQAGAILACGLAAAYVAAQWAYLGAVRLLMPTRDAAPLRTEALSHLSVLILVPALLGIDLPIPDPRLNSLGPLMYLGGCLFLHVLFKLATFYAAITSEASSRWGALGWLAGACVSAGAAYGACLAWLGALEEARPEAPRAVASYRIGDTYAEAREVPEGSVVYEDLTSYDGQCMTLRWANLPDAPESVEKVYVTVMLRGDDVRRHKRELRLKTSGWSAMRIAPRYIPPNVKTCTITWTHKRPPGWQKIVKVRPLATSEGTVLLSGPFEHRSHETSDFLNFLVVAVDGLGAAHVSSMGYEAKTTPQLDRFAYRALAFANAYTPASDPQAAYTTLLTGVGPLRDSAGTLAETMRAHHYATAAFTQGSTELAKDLAHGSGLERGFELFDDSCEPSGSTEATVDKACRWIAKNRDIGFFAFVRLRALEDFNALEGEQTEAGSDIDKYNWALAAVDAQIGRLIQFIKDYETGKNTCILVTSPYGLTFDRRGRRLRKPGLLESSLRVPLFLYIPGYGKSKRRDTIALQDVAPTLSALAGAKASYDMDGSDFLAGPTRVDPISLQDDPLVLSIRSGRWRCTWQSIPNRVELYDLTSKRTPQTNVAKSYPGSAHELAQRLEVYLTRYSRD